MNTIINTPTQGTNLEDLSLEVFLAAANVNDDEVRGYLEQVKANSETRKTVRAIQNLLAHMLSLQSTHGSALGQGTAPADAQADWNKTLNDINALIQTSPYVVEQLGYHLINHTPLEEVKEKLENAASNLGDLGQELQQRMSHAVNAASRQYELGSAVLKKRHETGMAIIRNI